MGEIRVLFGMWLNRYMGYKQRVTVLTILSEVPNAKGATSLDSEIRQVEVKVIMNSNEMMVRVFLL